MRSQSLARSLGITPLLFGAALLPAHAQYFTITKPQGALGRELSNPFPVANDLLTTNDLIKPDGTPLGNAPLPPRFVAFSLQVTVNMTDRKTNNGTDVNDPITNTDDIRPLRAVLSIADDTSIVGDRNGALNYNLYNSTFIAGDGNFSSIPSLYTPTTISAFDYLTPNESDSLIAALTPGGTINGDPAPPGFKPFVGPNPTANNARFYTYDTNASYRLILYTTNPVPEPGTVALLGAACVGSGLLLRRRKF